MQNSIARKNFSLTHEQKRDARDALRLIGNSKISLVEAVRIALHISNNAASAADTPITQGVDAFIESRKGKRPKTISYYTENLEAFAAAFPGTATLADITKPILKKYLDGLGGGPYNWSARFRAVRALYRWAIAQDPALCSVDPTVGMLDKRPKKGEAKFLPVADAAAIMAKAGRLSAAFALALFAGVRPDEIAGEGKRPLPWELVDMDARIIRIPSDIAKTETARIIQHAPDNLWAWLSAVPLKERVGAISPIRSSSLTVAAKKACGRVVMEKVGKGKVRRRKYTVPEGRKWPQDAMRHSFATYHVALLAEPGKTSHILGHGGKVDLLYNNYAGLATKAEAEKYFAIVPKMFPKKD